MNCPACHHPKSRLVDTSPMDNGSAQRRRRLCRGCGTRFTTVERVEVLTPGYRGKRDGDGFEAWLDGLPPGVNLGELRRAYERGLSREEAIGR